MIFLWVAGEEKGLWGSQYFNQFPPVDITKVVADLNMDMIGRSKTPGYVDPPSYKLAEPNEVFVVGPRVASDELGKILETVNGVVPEAEAERLLRHDGARRDARQPRAERDRASGSSTAATTTTS